MSSDASSDVEVCSAETSCQAIDGTRYALVIADEIWTDSDVRTLVPKRAHPRHSLLSKV